MLGVFFVCVLFCFFVCGGGCIGIVCMFCVIVSSFCILGSASSVGSVCSLFRMVGSCIVCSGTCLCLHVCILGRSS